ncbi:hypothetical protein EU546_00360 [Candidatus Thorarchaeota archaeon]|nr:MAG: hypothetical protein EU546_00360 [Candidatus Thorarchaeota archaeon]
MSTPKGEMLVLSPESAFQLKLIPLNPFEYTGAGIEIPGSSKSIETIRSSPEFGLRPLYESDLLSIAKAIGSEQESHSKLGEILGRTPESLEDLSSGKASHILRGPVLMRPDLGSLDPDVHSVQANLDKTAEKVFRKKYPMRSGMYF